MKVLVTGASGFLGKHVIQELERLQYDIDTIGRGDTATITTNISKEVPILSTAYDLVIHVAGKAHVVPKTEAEKKEFYDVNLTGTQNVLEALQNAPAYFVFISTVSVYGLDFGDNISEDAPLNAVEPYGKSKIMAEKMVTEWGKAHNTTTTILRLPLLFGINPPGNLKSMINAIQKKYYFNIGKGDVRKSMVFASDVAAFIPEIMKKGGIYNLTDGYHPSFKELSDRIAAFHKLKKPISIPHFIVWCMAIAGEVIQKVTRKKMPINKRQFTKMTKPLTFNDKKARSLGWNPKSIINHPKDWLNL
ncbi:NAD-dependent epimerase/dehydratase family protein [Kordia sp.]|uniref:NAD-dependent epimerase/dehydratase family protein n=1 Tax=Kordia sp. TaxID=1965332 RepID=UPI003D286CD1